MPNIVDPTAQGYFQALVNAVKNDQVRVYACLDRKTGDTVPTVCYVGPHPDNPEDTSQTAVVPLALLLGEEPVNLRLKLLRQEGEGGN
jgi:hypothetical protein